MKLKKQWLALVAGIAAFGVAGAFAQLPIEIDMDTDLGGAITMGNGGTLSFPGTYAQVDLDGGGYYFGPNINLETAGLGPVDLSGTNVFIVFDGLYYQDANTNTNPYFDAPIFVRLRDANNESVDLPNNYWGADYQGAWHTVANAASEATSGNPSFDLTQVRSIEFWGTDWAGAGDDYVQIDNVYIGEWVPPTVDATYTDLNAFGDCDAIATVTIDASASTAGSAPIDRFVFDYEGEVVEQSGATTTFGLLGAGDHFVTVTAYDESGVYDSMVVVVPVNPGLVGTPPVEMPLDAQIENLAFDPPEAIFNADGTSTFTFESEGGEDFVRAHLAGDGWYFAPYIDLRRACENIIDLSGDDMYVQAYVRYYQDASNTWGAYADAPIFVKIRDTHYRQADWEIQYAVQFGDAPYPEWTRLTLSTDDFASMDAGFDISQIRYINFYGTDWGGVGDDFVDVRDLYVGRILPPVADAGDDVTITESSCENVVTLDASGSTPGPDATSIVSYQWMNGETLVYAGDQAVVDVSLPGGLHTLTLTVENDLGATATDEKVIDIAPYPPTGLPVDISLGTQINSAITVGDGISSAEFISDEGGFIRSYLIGDGWYYGPNVDLIETCNGVVDLSAPNMFVVFEGRYYQDDTTNTNPYGDAPIFVQLRDVNGFSSGFLEINYWGADYPGDWHTVVTAVNPQPEADPEFDVTQVEKVEFLGTDWDGTGDDYVDIKSLFIGALDKPVADAGDDFVFESALTGCDIADLITLDASGSAPVAGSSIDRYVWEADDGSIIYDGGSTTAQAGVFAPGDHYFTLRVYDATGTYATDEIKVAVNPADVQSFPIPMDAQIPHSTYDAAIWVGGGMTDLLFGEEDGTFARCMMEGGGYSWGPYIDFRAACRGLVDMTGPNAGMYVTVRFYQDDTTNTNPYGDAPIFARLRDADYRRCQLKLIYQTAEGDDPYPTWSTKAAMVSELEWYDAGFEFDKVRYAYFYSTDWDGGGDDFTDFKNLFVGNLAAPTADAGEDQTIDTGDGCLGITTVDLTGSGTPGSGTTIEEYSWEYGGEEVGTNANLTYGIIGAGDHVFTLTVVNDLGMSSSDEVVVTVNESALQGYPIPLDEQITHGAMGDAILSFNGVDGLSFTEEDGSFVRATLTGGSWYAGPEVNLRAACRGIADLSDPTATIEFETRYYQDASNTWGAYADAPVFVQLFDTAGRLADYGIVYAVQNGDLPYPDWTSVTVNIADGNFDAGFDLTQVERVRFYGTDWGGVGDDFVDFRNLVVSEGGPQYCYGDTNCDGTVDFADINPFVAALSGEAAYESQYPGCMWLNADANQDGTVAFDDINPFVAILSSSKTCPPYDN